MAIHSIGVRHEDERYTDEFYDEISYWLLKLSFDELRLSKFFTCMNETRSDNCVQIVVDEGIVPSFDAYAIEIDALLGHGMKPVCIFHKGPIFNNLEEENIENE